MAIDLSDKDLITNALAGDQSAYREIVERYKDMVFTVARQLMRDEVDAEDLAQESFVKAFQSLAKFEGRSKLSTWLYQITYNSGLSKLRKKKIDLYNYDEQENVFEAFDDEASDGFDKVNADQRKEFVRTSMATLQEVDRTILTLFYFEDQNLQEISAICGMDPNTVKVKLHRARKRLEKNLTTLLKDELKDIA